MPDSSVLPPRTGGLSRVRSSWCRRPDLHNFRLARKFLELSKTNGARLKELPVRVA
jgi:hypothetical protein